MDMYVDNFKLTLILYMIEKLYDNMFGIQHEHNLSVKLFHKSCFIIKMVANFAQELLNPIMHIVSATAVTISVISLWPEHY